MSKINIRVMSDEALAHFKKNIKKITQKIVAEKNNAWVKDEFGNDAFIVKKYVVEDFVLDENPDARDKEIDLKNHIKLYDSLRGLPNYVLTDERFWLWLYLDKFYNFTKSTMSVRGVSTIKDHWMFEQGVRRGLMFGVLSRCFYRVALTVDNSREDKYELTRWVVEQPERFRNLTWRSFSSEAHLVRGIIAGEKKAVEEMGVEYTEFYTEIAKYISHIGSVRLLDVIDEKDIAEMVYKKMIMCYNEV